MSKRCVCGLGIETRKLISGASAGTARERGSAFCESAAGAFSKRRNRPAAWANDFARVCRIVL
jgi:hypothetical protein